MRHQKNCNWWHIQWYWQEANYPFIKPKHSSTIYQVYFPIWIIKIPNYFDFLYPGLVSDSVIQEYLRYIVSTFARFCIMSGFDIKA